MNNQSIQNIKEMNLFQKKNYANSLIENIAMTGKFESVSKSTGKTQSWKYAKSSDVLEQIRPALIKAGLELITEMIVETLIQEKQDYLWLTKCIIKYTWVNIDNPTDKIIILWYGEGTNTAIDKSLNAMLTNSEKYFLLKQFNIPTDEVDPDSSENTGKSMSKTVFSGVSQSNKYKESIEKSMNKIEDNLEKALEDIKNMSQIEQKNELWNKYKELRTNEKFFNDLQNKAKELEMQEAMNQSTPIQKYEAPPPI